MFTPIIQAVKSCASQTAIVGLLAPGLFATDIVLIHGHVYTGNDRALWSEAIAVTGGVIDAVGTDGEISARKDAKTKVIDLQGRTVIPGIVDSHTHMWFGGLALRGFNIATPELRITANQPDQLIAKIKEYAASHPADKVLFGRATFSPAPGSTATHQLLDQAVSDRPVVIHNTTEHSLWVNGKALEMAHVGDKAAADPLEEKYVVRDADGHPTGVLVDPAMQLVVRALPSETMASRLEVLRNAAHFLNQYGVTSVTNATGNLAEIEAYGALHKQDQLTVRTKTAFAEISVNHHLTPKFLDDLETARSKYHDDWVSANLVKFFADGSGATAAQLTPAADGKKSEPWYKPEDFQKILLALDERGYQLMTHAIGDAAVDMTLNSYEQVEKINGPRDRRLRMTHLFSITADDLPRFARLAIIPDMQPMFCCSISTPNRSHRWETLDRTGAKLAFSSDWPCTWPPDPFVAMQEAVTRESRGRAGEAGGKVEYFLPEERVTVQQAVDSYTKAGSYARFSEKRLGTLEAGKYADLVVLSQDIFAVPHDQIGKTHAAMTMVNGKVVYEAK